MMRGRGGCVIGTSLRLVVGSGRRGEEGGEEERIRIDGQDQEKNIPSLCPVLLFCCEPSQPFISKAPIAAASFLSFFIN